MAEKIKAAIKKIDEEVRRTQVNKSTEYHLGQLRAKHARLNKQLEEIAEADAKKQAGLKQGGKVVQARQAPKPSDLLSMMGALTDSYQFSFNQLVDESDSTARLRQLASLTHFDSIQQEAAVYLLKFDADGQVASTAQAKTQELYTLSPEERRERLVQQVCPFILDYAEALLAMRFKEEQLACVQRAIKAILPFASVGAHRGRIEALFQGILKRDDLEAFHKDAGLGLQLVGQ